MIKVIIKLIVGVAWVGLHSILLMNSAPWLTKELRFLGKTHLQDRVENSLAQYEQQMEKLKPRSK